MYIIYILCVYDLYITICMYIYHINVVQRSLLQNKYIYISIIYYLQIRFKLKHHKIIQNICTCMYTTKLAKNGPKQLHAVPKSR